MRVHVGVQLQSGGQSFEADGTGQFFFYCSDRSHTVVQSRVIHHLQTHTGFISLPLELLEPVTGPAPAETEVFTYCVYMLLLENRGLL